METIKKPAPRHVLGVDHMDEEHHRLEVMMDELYQCNDAYASKVEVLARLKALIEATEEHFEHEEAYMEEIECEGLHGHRIVHLRLLRALRKNEQEYAASPQARIPNSFLHFVKLWLHKHIVEDDKKYAEHATEIAEHAAEIEGRAA